MLGLRFKKGSKLDNSFTGVEHLCSVLELKLFSYRESIYFS